MMPVQVMIKPASGKCNMRCTYCFYADEMQHRTEQVCKMMSLDTLSQILKNVLQYASGSCSIVFQGGEPTLAGLEFYRQAVSYAHHNNVNECELHFSIQTNAYNLDEQWCRFLAEYKFLVGVSLDGYKELHDKYRKDAHGRGTFERVMHSIALLDEYHVSYNILTVIHRETAKNVSQIYNFFRRCHFTYQQYIECLDGIDELPGQQEYSLTPELYERFLVGMFRKWYRDMSKGHYVYNRYFENILMMMTGKEPESCSMHGRCARQLTVEADGNVYPCDFYALDQWKLGNLTTDTIAQLEQRRKELKFIQLSKPVPAECRECKWYPLCRNGCRRNCEPIEKEIRQKNYYCTAYKAFFEYAYPGLREILYKWI